MDLVTAVVCSPRDLGREQVVVLPRLGLLAVADAQGGGDGGRAGARLALDLVRGHVERHADLLERFRRNPAPQLRQQVLAIIEEGFTRAAQDLFAFARRRPAVLVTLDVVLLLDHEAFIGHVGDGRVYLVRRGLVHQLTVDHSRGDEAVRYDSLREDQATPLAPERVEARPTRALGSAPHVRVETLCMELAAEDRFVLCAATLHRTLPEPLLHTRLTHEHLQALPSALAADATRAETAWAARAGMPLDAFLSLR